jgi:hypothetical protein
MLFLPKTNGRAKETGSSKAAATVQLSAAAERAGARGGTFMQPKNRQRNAPFEVKNECTVRTSLIFPRLPRPCSDRLKKLEFFHSLYITSIFARMHEALNVDKKITNYIV